MPIKQPKIRIKKIYIYAAAICTFIGMFVIAILFGAANTSITDVWLAITTNQTQEPISVIRDFRLPRELAAVFVGAALAVAGAIMQGITRNPLADPGLLGLTAGANAILAITMAFFPDIHYFGIMIACFIGAAIGACMVYGIGALGGGKLSSFRIVLAGAAVSALLYAVEQGVGIYFKVSKDISMWTAGGFIGTTWTQLYVIVPFIVFGILLAIGLAKQLTILSLNEEVAIGLGQNTAMIKTILFLVVIILAGTAVALVGNIAFVGLMIPHIVRAIIGTDYRSVIPMSAIVGAIFMLFADTIARTLNAPFETPIIAVAAILGLPFFLMIVRKGSASL